MAEWLHANNAALDVQAHDGWTAKDGWTPMHYACREGHLEVAKWLHANDAALDVQAKNGITPIQLARQYRHGAVVDYLEAALFCERAAALVI